MLQFLRWPLSLRRRLIWILKIKRWIEFRWISLLGVSTVRDIRDYRFMLQPYGDKKCCDKCRHDYYKSRRPRAYLIRFVWVLVRLLVLMPLECLWHRGLWGDEDDYTTAEELEYWSKGIETSSHRPCQRS